LRRITTALGVQRTIDEFVDCDVEGLPTLMKFF
jgi:hypothetical protein